jgi:glycerol-3-phosphate cytidylyltransferase
MANQLEGNMGFIQNKVGFTAGSFDLFHAGHVAMLAECKKHCDYLIVAIQTNPQIDRKNKNKPVQNLIERQIAVQGCRYVDRTIVYETEADLEFLLQLLSIDIRFIGQDWSGEDFTGKDWCEDNGVELYYTYRGHGLSTSELRHRIKKS